MRSRGPVVVAAACGLIASCALASASTLSGCTIDFQRFDPRVTGGSGGANVGGEGGQLPVGGGGSGGAGMGGMPGGGGSGGSACPPQWSVPITGAGDQLVHDVASTSLGSAVVGSFDTEITFGDDTRKSAGGTDIFVAVVDTCGRPLWLRTYGGAADDSARGVTVDGSGHLIVVGDVGSAVDFGDGDGAYGGGLDVFVLELNGAGDFVTSAAFGGTGDESANAVDADPLDNIAVVGTINSATTFGGPTYTPPDANTDAFVAAFDTDLTHLWSGSAPSAGVDTATDVFVDASSRTYAIGTFTDDISFGPMHMLSSADGSADIYVIAFSTTGSVMWAAPFGSDADDQGKTITGVDDDGLIIGSFIRGTIAFGATTLTSTSLDYGVARLDAATGDAEWAIAWGDDSLQCTLGPPCDMSIASIGTRVVIGGQYANTLSPLGRLTATGEDGFLALVNAVTGSVITTNNVGGDGEQVVWGIGFDGTGAVHGGHYDTAFDVGGGALPAPNGIDGFVARSTAQ